MNLSIKDALQLLGLTSQATTDEIKKAYRKACAQYHPDRNPAGLQMMQLVNVAYQMLDGYQPTDAIDIEETTVDYGEQLNAALNLLISLGLEIELCGAWLWVHGNSYPHKDILKENGFMWAPKKKLWYFRPADYKSFGRGKWSMDEIREKHGSQKIITSGRKQIAA